MKKIEGRYFLIQQTIMQGTNTVESCQSRHYQTIYNCSLFIHALAKWLDITSFDAEMIGLCLDGKATIISLTIILINTLEAGSHTTALARFYSNALESV